ncbi:MAG: hypothetical protein LQ343_001532 [Gyalolechia ehrenbergii]|nr:MAG: hypothetical protein LQ343_001532 [Gyalolechia ehrenbergii]
MAPSTYCLGVDIGGTFTDLLLLCESTGEIWRAKVPSTPDDQSLAVISGKDQILKNIPNGTEVVLHAVNHDTERVSAWGSAPGRLASDGSEVRAFSREVFEERLQTIVKQKPDAVTISLMNSFANPAHEDAARKVVEEILPDVPVSISSDVLPELMEYERTMTTVVNSYVEPRVEVYLKNLLASLEGKAEHVRILRSDGGLSSVRLASRYPVTWVLSGPAGGVTGAASTVADHTEYKNLITLDMGGTSTDVALVESSAPRIRRETKIGDFVVKAPSIDVRSVGAGGGSIAHVPEVTKALRVGPESAGSVPGPACYGKGGSAATVTDANAVLGYLPTSLLGGGFQLDLAKAKVAVQKVADDLGVTLYGALRVISVEQGYDPRDFSLVAFGGAGPLHANSLGKLLGAYPVIIPPSPGILCALGEATTLLRHEIGKAYTRTLALTNSADVLGELDGLLSLIKEVMCDDQGVPEEKQTYTFQADLRYKGQANNVPIDIDLDVLKAEDLPYLRRLLDAEHNKLFTYTLSLDVEIVNLRVLAKESKVELPLKRLTRASSADPPESLISARATTIFDGREYENCPLWDRSGLLQGHVLHGPCVITEMDSTTVIHPGFKAEIDESANILIWEACVQDQHKDADKERELDAVTVDIFEHALRNARNEMDTLMTRTTMSPAIREQQDEFNVIAEPGGKMLVGQFGSFIGDFVDMWKGSIEPGDIFLTNDPYSVAGAISHHNDWLILMPIYVGSKQIAWAANFGHMTDVGGSVPGSLPCAANSIFEEGIQIPVTKVASKGVWNTDLMEVIYRNVRLPEWNKGDVRALVAACELAGRRMIELYQRFGDSLYFAAIDELLERNRKAVASIIKQMPEEPASFEDWIDDDGEGVGPWKIACTMTKKGEKLNFDFSGTDPQSPSSINFYLSITMFKMFVGIYMLVVHDANVVANDGFHDLLDVTIPEGTVLHPIRPAALSCRTHFLGRVMDVLSGLLGQRAPEFMTAAGFSDSPHPMYSGYRENGEWFQLYWIGFGGELEAPLFLPTVAHSNHTEIPARPIGDGPDGHCLWPAFKATPNEFQEQYYPLRIEQSNTVADSGGAGLYRGGNASRIFWRFLEEGTISTHDDRWLSKPWGVLGGQPGARSTKTLVKYSESERNPPRQVLGSKQDLINVSKGDILEWITWGGGGWGNPLKRDPETVALEVRRKLVTVEGAKRYGVVLREDLGVDLDSTRKLRERMQEAHKIEETEAKIFNRGGSWEELKAKSLEETGLPAPKAPWEVTLRGPMTQLPYFQKWQEQRP